MGFGVQMEQGGKKIRGGLYGLNAGVELFFEILYD